MAYIQQKTAQRGADRSIQDARTIQLLQPTTRVNKTPITSFGSVARSSGRRSGASRMPTAFTFTMANATAGALTYVMGDPIGLVAGALGAAFTQPTAVFGTVVAAAQASFNTMPVAVRGLNYEATSGAVQFGNLVRWVQADANGWFEGWPVNIDEYVRNNAQNPNLQTLEFDDEFDVSSNSCFTVLVAAGQTVKMTLLLGGAANR